MKDFRHLHQSFQSNYASDPEFDELQLQRPVFILLSLGFDLLPIKDPAIHHKNLFLASLILLLISHCSRSLFIFLGHCRHLLTLLSFVEAEVWHQIHIPVYNTLRLWEFIRERRTRRVGSSLECSLTIFLANILSSLLLNLIYRESIIA
jgi:hypothetical protein